MSKGGERDGVGRPLIRQPLVQFTVLGALVYALNWGLSEPEAEGTGANVILISNGFLEGLRASEQRRVGDAANDPALIASHVRDEVLYREAVALGLDVGTRSSGGDWSRRWSS